MDHEVVPETRRCKRWCQSHPWNSGWPWSIGEESSNWYKRKRATISTDGYEGDCLSPVTGKADMKYRQVADTDNISRKSLCGCEYTPVRLFAPVQMIELLWRKLTPNYAIKMSTIIRIKINVSYFFWNVLAENTNANDDRIEVGNSQIPEPTI